MKVSHDGKDDHFLHREIIIANNTDSYGDDEYIASTGDNSHKYSLEDGYSTSGGDELEYTHCVNLQSYLLRDTRNFDIDDIYEEDNERFYYDIDIDRDEIDDIYYACGFAKEIK